MYASQSVKKKNGVELWGLVSIYRHQRALKNRYRRLGCESGCILLRKDRKVYALLSPECHWAKAQQGKIRPFWSAVQHSKSAELAFGHQTLFHVRVPFGLPLLRFFNWSLYLDTFSSSVYDFSSLFLWIIQTI